MMSNYDMNLFDSFKSIIENERWLMQLLLDIRKLGLKDWYVAGGAIRNTIWDVLHGYEKRTPLNDVDLVYFDEGNLNPQKDKLIEHKLRKVHQDVNWEVVNQARMKERIVDQQGIKVISSTTDSISYWSDTSTCVGVRLEEDGSLSICAPHGLGDLMTLKVRPVPRPYTNSDLYKKRMLGKKWKDYWPKLTIELF